jgi:hypothetical protein
MEPDAAECTLFAPADWKSAVYTKPKEVIPFVKQIICAHPLTLDEGIPDRTAV